MPNRSRNPNANTAGSRWGRWRTTKRTARPPPLRPPREHEQVPQRHAHQHAAQEDQPVLAEVHDLVVLGELVEPRRDDDELDEQGERAEGDRAARGEDRRHGLDHATAPATGGRPAVTWC